MDALRQHHELSGDLLELLLRHAQRGIDRDEQPLLGVPPRCPAPPRDLEDAAREPTARPRPRMHRGARTGDEHRERRAPVHHLVGCADRVGEVFDQVSGGAAGDEIPARYVRHVVVRVVVVRDRGLRRRRRLLPALFRRRGGRGLGRRRPLRCALGSLLRDGPADQQRRLRHSSCRALAAREVPMVVDRTGPRLARAGLRPRSGPLQMPQQDLVTLARALPRTDPDRRVRPPRDRGRELLLDVLVRGHLDREVHQLGLFALRELRMREVPEDDVMHLVEEHAPQELRLRDERVDVHVEVEPPVVERHRHARHGRVRHRGHLCEDRGVIRVGLEERGVADEAVEPRLELAACRLRDGRRSRGHRLSLRAARA